MKLFDDTTNRQGSDASSVDTRPGVEEERERQKDEAKSRAKRSTQKAPQTGGKPSNSTKALGAMAGSSKISSGQEGGIKDIASDVMNSVSKDSKGGDPMKAIGSLADKYLGLGSKVGFLLWAIWSILAIALLILPPWIIGLVALLILNLMLVWPKGVFWITVGILMFFGVGEAIMEVYEEMHLQGVKITITWWQKALILVVDIVFVIIVLLIMAIAVALISWYVCTDSILGGGWIIKIAVNLSDWWNNTQYAGAYKDMCDAVKSVIGK